MIGNSKSKAWNLDETIVREWSMAGIINCFSTRSKTTWPMAFFEHLHWISSWCIFISYSYFHISQSIWAAISSICYFYISNHMPTPEINSPPRVPFSVCMCARQAMIIRIPVSIGCFGGGSFKACRWLLCVFLVSNVTYTLYNWWLHQNVSNNIKVWFAT